LLRLLSLILLLTLAHTQLTDDVIEESDEMENVDSEWLSYPETTNLIVTETAPQCGNEEELFPETGVEDLPDDIDDQICASESFYDVLNSDDRPKPKPKPKPKPHHKCKMCCKIGAVAGKKVRKGKCPFVQCRNFFISFYKEHKKCIRDPKKCGFFFVKCCVRQHHKDIYAPQEVEYNQANED